MEKIERTVKLDPDAAELLIKLAGSSRKQGAYLSELIRSAAAVRMIDKSPASSALEEDVERLREKVRQLSEEVERLRQLVEGNPQF